MTVPNAAPFPGAEKNPMLLIGMPDKPLKAPNYFELEANQAVTFSAARPVMPVTLTPGDKLYRVFGGPAAASGGFWAPQKPTQTTTQAEWRSTNAVEPIWNAGTHIVEMEVNPHHTVQTWTGQIESQPARNDKGKIIKDWWLPGGGTQYFFQFWTQGFKDAVTLTVLGQTPWTAAGEAAPSLASSAPKLACSNADLDLSDVSQSHIAAVAKLSERLKDTAQTLEGEGRGQEASAVNGSADTLIAIANGMIDDLGKDDEALALGARGQLDIGRQIDFDATWPKAADTAHAIRNVVHTAAVICGRTG